MVLTYLMMALSVSNYLVYEATRLAYASEEAQEGRDAFLEKRDQDFSKFPWHY